MGPKTRLALLLALCIVGGFFAGRVWWSLGQAPPSAAAVTGPSAVTSVPDLRLPDLAGEERSLREWSAKPMLINFWATWCAPCRKEMPLLEEIHQSRGGQLAVIGIAIDREEPVRTFIAETGVSYPILVGQDTAMAAAEAFGPQFAGLPLTVVAAPGGDILGLHLGELHPEDLAVILGVLDDLVAGRSSVDAARETLAEHARRT